MKTVSNKIKVQDHYPVLAEPGGEYVTHVTLHVGSRKVIAKELVDVVRERNMRLNALGMDGCAVNTGIHKGVYRCMELELGYSVQHIICLLHFNELFFHHVVRLDQKSSKDPLVLPLMNQYGHKQLYSSNQYLGRCQH